MALQPARDDLRSGAIDHARQDLRRNLDDAEFCP